MGPSGSEGHVGWQPLNRKVDAPDIFLILYGKFDNPEGIFCVT
jgi:hypothetical protein